MDLWYHSIKVLQVCTVVGQTFRLIGKGMYLNGDYKYMLERQTDHGTVKLFIEGSHGLQKFKLASFLQHCAC